MSGIFILTGAMAWIIYGTFILCLFVAELKNFGTLAFLAALALGGYLWYQGAHVEWSQVWYVIGIYLCIGILYAFFRRAMFFKSRDIKFRKVFAEYKSDCKAEYEKNARKTSSGKNAIQEPVLAYVEKTKEDFLESEKFRWAIDSVSDATLAALTARWLGNWPVSAIVYTIETIFPKFFDGIVQIFKGFFKIADNLEKGDWEK